jgi:thiol-disulfide isomerase/thioredoxin
MVLCVVMTGANIYLLHLNKNLKTATAGTLRSAGLPAGKEVKAISGVGFNGEPLSFSTSGGHATLLMVYSPVCPYCERNWPNWSSLVNTAHYNNVNFLAVDLTEKAPPDFLVKKNMAHTTAIHRMDPQEIVDLNLMLTPETVLVGQDSKIKKAWYGVLSRADLAELNKMLSEL